MADKKTIILFALMVLLVISATIVISKEDDLKKYKFKSDKYNKTEKKATAVFKVQPSGFTIQDVVEISDLEKDKYKDKEVYSVEIVQE